MKPALLSFALIAVHLAAGCGGDPLPVVTEALPVASTPVSATPPVAPAPVATSPVSATPPVAPAPVAPAPLTEMALVPSSGSCAVRLSVRLSSAVLAKGGTTHVEARAENKTDVPQTIELVRHCGIPAIRYTGLSEGYDYHGECMAGACPPEAPTITVVIPAHGSVALGSGSILHKGDTCRKPIKPGTYPMSFSVQEVGSGPAICAPKPASLVVK
jgi:hypothetical protein